MATRFGERLRQARLQRGLTQEALARQASVSLVTVAKLERAAHRRPTVETAAKLAKALGVDPAWLLFGDEEGYLARHGEPHRECAGTGR